MSCRTKEGNDIYLRRIKPKVDHVLDGIFAPLQEPQTVTRTSATELSLAEYQLPGAILFLGGIPRRGGFWPTQCIPDEQLFGTSLTEAQLQIVDSLRSDPDLARRIRIDQVPPWYRSSPSALPKSEDRLDYLSSLEDEKWLNDITIDSYCTLIHWWQSTYRKHPSSGQPPSLIMPARFSAVISAVRHAGDDLPFWKILCKRDIDPFSYDHILIPYNVHENHWITVAVDISSRRVYIFDSLPCRTKALQRVFESVQAWLVEYEKVERDKVGEPEPEAWSLTIPMVDVQLNLDDCGPLMLQTMMNICRLQNLDAVSHGFGQFETASSSPSASQAVMTDEKKQKSQDLRQKMSIELIQQKLLLRTQQDDRLMWIDPTKAATCWERTCMIGAF